MKIQALFLSFSLLVLSACAPLPPLGAVNWRPSPNFDERRPNFIIIHQTTSDSAEHALKTLTDPQRKVSAHYLIGRDGKVFQLVDERQRAWHAGQSWWGGNTDLNSSSIGIELDNTGEEPFGDLQIAALIEVLRDLRERYRIPAANIIGHSDVAPRRKVDPSRYFPWQMLAEQGFGLWCFHPVMAAPPDFNAILGLQALGYDVTDPEAAIGAFRRHFVGEDGAPILTRADVALLHCLLAARNGTDTVAVPARKNEHE
ncbi:MAG: N-acetylmuramoyl-L-alanine amidase [Betaproteobacteria bacterium]